MGLLDRDTRRELLDRLNEIALLQKPIGLDVLLQNQPPELVRQVQRTGVPAVDVPALVTLCDGWDPAQESDVHPLHILIENAGDLVANTHTAEALKALAERLPRRAAPGGGMSIPAATLHQLRPPVGDFVGRADEIAQVTAAVRAAQGRGAGAAISGIRGMGGLGKTELAYAVAAALAGDFPDAQLLVELRGASAEPLPAAQAVQQVIRAFEPVAQLPSDLPALQALYRAVLTGKRVLVLADDAADATQVRPLLPPAGCALLVTSRQRFTLPGLAALDLCTLPRAEAEALLWTICPRIGDAAEALARLCGYLPLALRVSAGLLATTPRPVAAYLQALADERTRLRGLRDPDDPALDVEAAIGLSVAALDAAAQTVLAQLGVFPAPFDRAAAAAVLALPGADGGALDDVLTTLYRRSLLDWDATTERYSLHDLVRAFALARLGADEDATRLRHAQYYAQVAKHAGDLYDQGGDAMLAGLRLFDQERAQIDAGWGWARERAGRDGTTDGLLLDYAVATVHTGDLRYDQRRERIPQLEAALAAARRLGRSDHEGYALGNLGNAYWELGEVRQAIRYYEQHLEGARANGDRHGEASDLGNLGLAYADLGEARRAIEYYEQQLEIARAIGHRVGEGRARQPGECICSTGGGTAGH